MYDVTFSLVRKADGIHLMYVDVWQYTSLSCLSGRKDKRNVQRWFELNVPVGVGLRRVIYGINVTRIGLLALIELEFVELTFTDIRINNWFRLFTIRYETNEIQFYITNEWNIFRLTKYIISKSKQHQFVFTVINTS